MDQHPDDSLRSASASSPSRARTWAARGAVALGIGIAALVGWPGDASAEASVPSSPPTGVADATTQGLVPVAGKVGEVLAPITAPVLAPTPSSSSSSPPTPAPVVPSLPPVELPGIGSVELPPTSALPELPELPAAPSLPSLPPDPSLGPIDVPLPGDRDPGVLPERPDLPGRPGLPPLGPDVLPPADGGLPEGPDLPLEPGDVAHAPGLPGLPGLPGIDLAEADDASPVPADAPGRAQAGATSIDSAATIAAVLRQAIQPSAGAPTSGGLGGTLTPPAAPRGSGPVPGSDGGGSGLPSVLPGCGAADTLSRIGGAGAPNGVTAGDGDSRRVAPSTGVHDRLGAYASVDRARPDVSPD